MRRLLTGVATAVVLFPTLAGAASTAQNAGFAPGALWLSTTTAAAGDTVKIFTAIYDASSIVLDADVAFDADGSPIGSQHVHLAPGESQIVSVEWTAVEGSHEFSASFKNSSVTSLANAKTNSTSIAVAAAPAQAAAAALPSQVTNILAAAPAPVQNVVATIASTTEGVRAAGDTYFANALKNDALSAASGTVATKETPTVLGTSTTGLLDAPALDNNNIFSTARHYLLVALHFMFDNVIAFYIGLLVVIYLIFRIFKLLIFGRREAY